MGKTSSAVKNRYNDKAYDRINLTIPKGQKQAVEAHAKSIGKSVNGMVNELLRAELGLTEETWKNPAPAAERIEGHNIFSPP